MRRLFEFALIGVLIVSSFYVCDVEADLTIKNHEFSEIRLGYSAGYLCSFQYASVYFCDKRHLVEIENALGKRRPNFDHHYILLSIDERKEYFQRSLVVVDVVTGIVYPLPFDFYSGDIGAEGNARDYGRLSYRMGGSKVCVIGAIVAHRQIDSGRLCWDFDGTKFVGHRTPYMD